MPRAAPRLEHCSGPPAINTLRLIVRRPSVRISTTWATGSTSNWTGRQNNPIVSGFLLPLDLPGTSTYLEDIATCNGQPVALRELMPLAPPPAGGSTYAALQALFAQDPGATWDFATRTIGNSCAPQCAAVSPRLIAVALFDPDQYQLRRATVDWSGCPNSGSLRHDREHCGGVHPSPVGRHRAWSHSCGTQVCRSQPRRPSSTRAPGSCPRTLIR